ncbi:MAG: serine/threonine-protein kinase, partial [Bryobacteraceae bacterium]
IRREVESLLKHDQTSGELLAAPIARFAESVLPSFSAAMRCGPYELRELIGRGGMGAVYRAERADGELRQQAAVKLMQTGSSGAAERQRFLQERQILAGLSHSNIAALLDAGHTETGQPFFVMELVEGTRIDEFCEGLPLVAKVELFLKVCDAVSFAHRRLVVHRDLKPSNILVTKEGAPKLLDFGIAKMLDFDDNMTLTWERVMTPAYGSPEQASGTAVTTATDIYSLGAVLYKLLTGHAPHQFEGTTPEAMLASIVARDVVRARDRVPELAGDLDAIVMKTLRKEPDQRYSTVDQLVDDLKSYLQSRPIRARQGEFMYRSKKFVRRYWIPLAASAAAVAALATGLIVVAREKELADRRFRLVRSLAGDLFEVEKQVQPLDGSTAARQYIADTALRYLGQLSGEANEPDLLLELGEAYQRTAAVLSRRGAASLGKSKEAQAALDHGELLLEKAIAARPKHLPTLRAMISNRRDSAALTTRTDGDTSGPRKIEQLLHWTNELAAANPSLDDYPLLAGAYAILNSTWVNEGRLEEARKYGELAVDYQRRYAEGKGTPDAKLRYAAALRTQGTFLRYDGQLERAVATLEQAISIIAAVPAGKQQKRELSVALYYLGITKGEVNALSLGQYGEASAILDRRLQLCREMLAADPLDQDARQDLSQGEIKQAKIVNRTDPARALVLFDEAFRSMSAAPETLARRDNYLILALAESTFSLRMLGRHAEILQRFAQIRKILGPLDPKTANFGPTGTLESYLRAEAEEDVASGRLSKAIAIYRMMLDKFAADGYRPREDLADGLGQSLALTRLAELYQLAGDEEQSGRVSAQREELWRMWNRRLPDNSFVMRELEASTRGLKPGVKSRSGAVGSVSVR